MATKSTKKVAVTWKKGEYVRYDKKPAVITDVIMEELYDEDSGEYRGLGTKPEQVSVEYVTENGDSESENIYEIKKLTKIPAPQYVVVWTDADSDPFTQFETKAVADKFVAKKRKEADVVEVRIYKLTK